MTLLQSIAQYILGAMGCSMSERCTTANIKFAFCFAICSLGWAIRLAVLFLLADRRLPLVSLAWVFALRLSIFGIPDGACFFEI